MVAVILAGGRGIRLWPESRQLRPKQLCKFADGKSMLQNTLERLVKVGFSRLIIVTGDDLKNAVEQITDQLDSSVQVEILTEPEGKNTAPAVAFALSACLYEAPDTLIGVFPADHHITDFSSFSHCLAQAEAAATHGYLTILGVTPQRPETGYGYIEKSRYEFAELPQVYPVQTFCEKPPIHVAQDYVKSGRHSWNVGVYIGRRDIFMREFEKFLPDLYGAILTGAESFRRSYSQHTQVSIDCGIAEKSDRMAVVNGDFGWCDLGSWNALTDLYQADAAENTCSGEDVLLLKSRNCLIKQQNKTLVLYGVQNLLVVETDDVVLIADRERTQEVREITASLKELNRSDLL